MEGHEGEPVRDTMYYYIENITVIWAASRNGMPAKWFCSRQLPPRKGLELLMLSFGGLEVQR
jgi:flavin reductase (DIM6/NTAB) family NADH-FMN oxidoreductase RutF